MVVVTIEEIEEETGETGATEETEETEEEIEVTEEGMTEEVEEVEEEETEEIIITGNKVTRVTDNRWSREASSMRLSRASRSQFIHWNTNGLSGMIDDRRPARELEERETNTNPTFDPLEHSPASKSSGDTTTI